MPIGAALVDLLLDCATISVSPEAQADAGDHVPCRKNVLLSSCDCQASQASHVNGSASEMLLALYVSVLKAGACDLARHRASSAVLEKAGANLLVLYAATRGVRKQGIDLWQAT